MGPSPKDGSVAHSHSSQEGAQAPGLWKQTDGKGGR